MACSAPITFGHKWRFGNLQSYLKFSEVDSHVQSPCYHISTDQEIVATQRILFYPKGTQTDAGQPSFFLKLVSGPTEMSGDVTMTLWEETSQEVLMKVTVPLHWYMSIPVHVCSFDSDQLANLADAGRSLTLECNGSVVFSAVTCQLDDQVEALEPRPFPPNLYDMLRLDRFTDVILITPHTHYRAHRLVMSSWSTFFADMFCDDDPRSGTCQVFLHDVFDWQVIEILNFMYRGHVENLPVIARGLLPVASRFRIEALQCLCESQLTDDLQGSDESAAIDLITLAFRFGSEQFKASAITFLQSNLHLTCRQEWTDLALVDPVLMYHIMNILAIEVRKNGPVED